VSRPDLLGDWTVEGYAGATLTFVPDGTLAGSTGVNRVRGRYTYDAAALLSVGPLIATRMAGPPEAMEAETRLLRALGQARTARAGPGDDDVVVLEGATDTLVLRRTTLTTRL
jgi:heat shock protein HslJ